MTPFRRGGQQQKMWEEGALRRPEAAVGKARDAEKAATATVVAGRGVCTGGRRRERKQMCLSGHSCGSVGACAAHTAGQWLTTRAAATSRIAK